METIPNNQPSTITVHRRRSVCESDLSPTISLIRRVPDYHLADQAITGLSLDDQVITGLSHLYPLAPRFMVRHFVATLESSPLR